MRSFKSFHFERQTIHLDFHKREFILSFFEISRAVKPQYSRGRSVPGPRDYQGPLRLSGVSLLTTFLFCCVSQSQKYRMLVEKRPFLFLDEMHLKTKILFFLLLQKKGSS